MQKVAEGDTSFVGRLCAQLADRLLFIPTKAQAKNGPAVKVSIVRLFEDGKFIVPVFTAERKLRDWATKSGRSVDSISLLGADFCSALDGATSIAIDLGFEPAVTIGPDFVREISMSGGSGDYGEIARAVADRVKTPVAVSPTAQPSAPSSLASFPSASPPESAPPPEPSPIPLPVRKEEFPPFVPPSAQPVESSRRHQRVVEERETPIGETIRAHRSSLAAGALLGESSPSPLKDTVARRSGVEEPVEAEESDSQKKKGLFGLFSKE